MKEMTFRKAERKKAKLRLSVAGVTGAGKTCSSILIGKGLGGKMAMIDTENGRGDIHAHLADYDILRLEAPFTPQKYIDAIKLAEQEGYEVLIIDSLSHEWAGSGGCLEMAENVARYSKNPNKFAAWADVTPQHNKLIETIVSSRMHIIATMRSKSSYEVCENEKGKKVPTKVRLAPVQREGMEFEFNVVLEIEKHRGKNIASASKDDTGIFKGDKEYFTPSVETGEELLGWLNTGVDETQAINSTLEALFEKIKSAKAIDEMKGAANEAREFAKLKAPARIPEIRALHDERMSALTGVNDKWTEAYDNAGAV